MGGGPLKKPRLIKKSESISRMKETDGASTREWSNSCWISVWISVYVWSSSSSVYVWSSSRSAEKPLDNIIIIIEYTLLLLLL